MSRARNQKTWDENHRKILNSIRKLVDSRKPSRISEITCGLSRQTIYEHLKKAQRDGEIVKENHGSYYPFDFIEKRRIAEEAYNEIINFSKESIEARGYGWWRYMLGDKPQPYHWLDSVKDIREDFTKIRLDDRKDRKRAEREGVAIAEAFLSSTEVNVGTIRGEIRLKDSGKLTRVSGFLPFFPKVKESWDAEVYDQAMSIAYMIYKQLDPHSTMTISSDSEIIIRIRLNLWEFMKALFRERYWRKSIDTLRSLEREPIFPEFEKMRNYQEYEKAENELRKAEQKMSLMEQLREVLKRNNNQEDTEDSKTGN